MNSYKKLITNSGIFAVANLGSKILSFLLVPYYTYVLSAEEYGTIDMLMTIISLLLPIISLSIFDATLRFTMKSGYSKTEIFSLSFWILLVGNFVFLLFAPIMMKIEYIQPYIFIFYMLIILQSINSLLSQFVRGVGEVKIFAYNGVLLTIINLILNIVFLTVFRMGIVGYFISSIIAYLVCNIYLSISVKSWRYLKLNLFDKNLILEMLGYCIPLIPNTLMWWVMNVSDRFMIAAILGVSANGLYAVANKIPTFLTMLHSIFSQAWQLSAIEEGESSDKSLFYTNVFKIFSVLILIATSAILVVVKQIMEQLLAPQYSDSWKYVPFLLLSVVFTSFSSFLGTNYIAMKKTGGILKTSIVGAITNILLNIILIPRVGINGASISTMISFLVVWIVRVYDTREFVKIKLDVSNLLVSLSIIFIQIFILYLNIRLEFIVQGALFVIFLLISRKTVLKFIKSVIGHKLKYL